MTAQKYLLLGSVEREGCYISSSHTHTHTRTHTLSECGCVQNKGKYREKAAEGFGHLFMCFFFLLSLGFWGSGLAVINSEGTLGSSFVVEVREKSANRS